MTILDGPSSNTPRTLFPNMQLRDTLELQKVSKLPVKRGFMCNFSTASGVPLWTWLLLGTLLAPGAWSLLGEEEEELLVELHNYYRGQVSPSSSAMLPLKWDPRLKLLAEGYAAKCIWNHNPDNEDTGENLYAGTGPLDLRVALEKWFLENLFYDFHNNSCDENKMCGHYTQMVWSDTHRVGCAAHLCNKMEGLAWEKISFLVCNYYPAGNYESERPYVEGDSCSRCPEELQTCENNLCVPDMDDSDGGEEEEEEDAATTESFYQITKTSTTGRHMPQSIIPTLLPPLLTFKPNFTPGDKEDKEKGVLVHPLATTESHHNRHITTRTSRTTHSSMTPTLPLVTPKPKLFSGEEEEEKGGVLVLSLATTESYHQADISSSPGESGYEEGGGFKDRTGQQETRLEGLPIITIPQKEIMSEASSLSSPTLVLAALLFFNFILIMLPL
ncbi:uncharacterized protein ACBT44_021808 [Syngnathus typhle]